MDHEIIANGAHLLSPIELPACPGGFSFACTTVSSSRLNVGSINLKVDTKRFTEFASFRMTSFILVTLLPRFAHKKIFQ